MSQSPNPVECDNLAFMTLAGAHHFSHIRTSVSPASLGTHAFVTFSWK